MRPTTQNIAILLTSIPLVFAISASRASSAPAVPDLQSSVKAGRFEATPPAGHHFNAKAPAEVKGAGAPLKFELTDKKLSAGLAPHSSEQELAVEVFVCDDANTFCRKKIQAFRVPAVTQAAAEPATTAQPAAKPAGAKAAQAHFEKDTGFYVNDPEKAFALAARKKLPLMIDFFGIWCPPCNHLDAMVFRSREFQAKSAGRFVKLKLDTDDDRFNALKSRYKIQGLPTVVFATSAGDEIFRLLGFHPLKETLAKTEAAYHAREEGFAALETQAKAGNADARYKAARIALDRDEPERALELLRPLKDLLQASHDSRLVDWYRAQLGAAQSASDAALARATLEKWLKDFPESPASIENYQSLAEIQDQSGDKDGSRASLASAVALTERLLASPLKVLEGSDYTPADLAESRADLLEKGSDPAKTKEAYLACAAAYLKEGQAEGSAYPRGPNLERAYCLGKAGEIAQSEAIYREGIRRFPGEYTFYQGLAKLLLDSAKDAAKALPQAQKAVTVAYGNQRLKATMTVVRAFEALHQPERAIEAAEAELKQPEPEGAIVSTRKLRERLKAKVEELRKKPASAGSAG